MDGVLLEYKLNDTGRKREYFSGVSTEYIKE